MNRPYSITLICLISILTFVKSSFAQFTDDFSDGDLTNIPTWSGDAAEFIVDNNMLRSNGPATSAELYLSTPTTIINTTRWEFLVRFDFSPSSSNLARVYLVSDQADLESDLNGYYLEIGQTGDDQIKLFRQDGASQTLIFTGASLFTGNVLVRIKIERDDIGTWQVFSDITGNGNYTNEGASFVDDIYTSTSYFGVFCKHTSSRKDLFFFDDFNVEIIVPDTEAPRINSIAVVSTTEIDVQFSELLDQTTAETTSNYSVDGGIGQPTSATLDVSDNTLVHLTFSNTFTNSIQYQLTVQNVEDLNSNAIATEQENFTVLIPEVAEVGDLLINEIMVDPTPSVALPEEEFVEIHNGSNKYIDLDGYTLSGKTIINSQYIIAPSGYVILCDDSDVALFQSFGNVIGIPSWNTLTNGGETITLRDENKALTINEIIYDLSWYQDESKDDGGYSIELINPNSLCSGSLNWSSSNDAKGGTPGAENSLVSAVPDTQAPSILSVGVVNFAQLIVGSDETINPTTISEAKISITGGITVSQATSSGNSFLALDLANQLSGGVEYTLTIEGIGDCTGNNIVAPGVTFTFEVPEVAEFKDIVINEIMADPLEAVGLPEAEFMEIYNNSTKKIELNGYLLNGKEIINSTFLFLPGEYLILCPEDNASSFVSLGTVIGMSSWDGLNNNGESVTLVNGSGATIDKLAYGTSWYNSSSKSEGGWTLELIDPDNLCSDEENWTASIDPTGGTPGQINSVDGSKPDLSGPELIEMAIPDTDNLFLYFDERLDTISIMSASYTLEPAIGIASVSFDPSLFIVELHLQSGLSEQVLYTITVGSLTDCSGNTIGDINSLTFALPQQAEEGDIIINEVLFNPREGANDFVEIYNNSDKYINLQGWLLANEDKNENIENLKLITDRFKLIAPEEILAFTTDALTLASEYPFSNEEQYFELIGMPTFSNTEGTVVVLKADSTLHDRFDYDENMHHPLLHDVDGISLERISATAQTNDPDNWHSAASNVLATPGNFNSQLKQSVAFSGEVEVSPRIFIPDNSGTDDFTSINYQFDQPGFVANVKIVDATGHEVLRLAENELLPTTGFFTWNGTFEDGRKAKVGVYIVYFEVFDTQGTVRYFKERVVIGSNW